MFFIPIQNMLNKDIPEFFVVDTYEIGGILHTIIDADLSDEGLLHRFVNPAGVDYSAIYRAGLEVWSAPRKYEPHMIKEWNDIHDR